MTGPSALEKRGTSAHMPRIARAYPPSHAAMTSLPSAPVQRPYAHRRSLVSSAWVPRGNISQRVIGSPLTTRTASPSSSTASPQ